MADPDVDEIFKDFEYKVKGKKDAKEAQKQPVRKFIDDEEEERPKKQFVKQEILPPKQMLNYEKIAYIAIILVLAAYVGIDWMYYHTENDVQDSLKKINVKLLGNPNETNKTTAAKNQTAAVLNKSAESKPAEKAQDSAKVEDKTLSGAVTLTIDKVHTTLSKSINDTGSIDTIDFTIENGKDKTLNPRVDIYAYDADIDKIWETKSRGQYLGAAIGPGKKYIGSISLSPKTFKKMSLVKNIRLSLNDTSSGFITADNEEIKIS